MTLFLLNMTSPQLQGEDNDAVGHTLGPSRGAFGPGRLLDRVRHETQRSCTFKGSGTRLELDSVQQPGCLCLFCRRPRRCPVGHTERLLVLRPQVFQERDTEEEASVA